MPIWIAMTAAVLLGVLLTVQPALNAIVARAIGSPYGATGLSLIVSTIAIAAIVAFAGRGDTSRAALASVPWWAYLAGLVGTAFVLGSTAITPVTGALVFFVCVVAGQLCGALVTDHFGLFGLQVRPASPTRLVGLALVVVGALLVRRG
jgi:transporter family-2 protein